MIKKLFNNNWFLPSIMSIFTYISLCFQEIIVLNKTQSFLIYLIIATFFFKTDLKKKRFAKDTVILSLVLAFLLVSGRILYNFRYSAVLSFWNELFSLKTIIFILGNFSLIYGLLINIIPKLIHSKVIKEHKNKIKNIWLVSFLIIFVCWLPYFIIYYPGILSGDSLSEMQMVMGLKPITDHHTVLHVLSIYIPYNITFALTHNINLSVAMVVLVQMIIMAAIFAYTIKFFYKRNVNKYILLIILAFYALFPVNGFYSITLWKDVIFSGCVLLLTLECIKLLEKKGNITLKNSYTFVLVSLLTIFFRNNAIYMYFIFILVTLFVFRREWKIFLKMFVIIITIFIVIKGPIYNALNIKKSASAEYIAMPLQQIGRMAYKEVEFTEKEEKLINELIPVTILKEKYNAEIVDSIKFNENYNSEAFENNKLEYLKLWLNLCVKHFDIATEAYLTSTLGYWYPDTYYWISMAQIDENELGIENQSIVPDSIRVYTHKILNRSVPIFGIIYSIGMCFWAITIGAYLTIKNKNAKMLYIFVPVFGIWLTMMIASPVFSEFRYVYSAFTTLPVLLLSYKINSNNN